MYRKNTVIREVEVTEEKLERMKQLLRKSNTGLIRRNAINEIFGRGCCVCGDIPKVEVLYKLKGGGKRIERYCSICKNQVFERMEPKNREEMAEEYGCDCG